MVLFQQQYQSLCLAMGFGLWLSGVNFRTSSLSDAEQLVNHNFCTSKELWSSAKVHFYSALTQSWSCSHASWWFSLILFSWASIMRLPLLSLQEAHTHLWYLLWSVHTNTSSVSEHVMQCPEAVSMSESSTFSHGKSESDEAWSPVLHKLSTSVPLSGSAMALVGLEGALTSSCSHCSELGPASSISSGVFGPM